MLNANSFQKDITWVYGSRQVGTHALTSKSTSTLMVQRAKIMSRLYPRTPRSIPKRRSQPNINLPLKENMGTVSEPKVVVVSAKLKWDMKNHMIILLNESKDAYAWSYKDMPGFNTDILVHHLPLNLEYKPVKQILRRMKPEWTMKIK